MCECLYMLVIWRVYLLGYVSKVELQLANMVTSMGGAVTSQFNSQVDVLVTDSITEDVTRLISEAKHTPQIATSKWIKDSFQQKQFLHLGPYSLNLFPKSGQKYIHY